AMAIIFLEGIIILLLVICGLRKAIMDAIPADLRRAIGIGIGLFIAFIGLKGGELVVADASTFIAFGDVTSPVCIVALVGLLCAIILHALKVKGGLVISIIVATIVAFPLGVTSLPETWNFGLDFGAFFAPFQTDPGTGSLAVAAVFLKPALLLVVFSLLMSDFFDTMGTVLAVGNQANFADKDGNVEDIQPILMVDSAAAAVGGLFGASSITSFVESTSGAAAGARTGLSNVVIAVLFFICAFLAPVFGIVPGAATTGALVVVGFLMMGDVANIAWDKVELGFPAFLTIIGIPFTYSITNGIGLGFISYVLIMVFMGKVKQVKPLMWVAAAAFLVMFIFV
ncbi:MAG: NCS2 family permease, partial [Eggerthellaceae bacterium]|nr:NCS2 family permease [Eggerthellaceae bacterium]